MHQNNAGMGHGRKGSMCAEHPKKVNLPHTELTAQMPNYVNVDLIYM